MPLTTELILVIALAMTSGAYLQLIWRSQVDCRAALRRLERNNQRHLAWLAGRRLQARARFCHVRDQVWGNEFDRGMLTA